MIQVGNSEVRNLAKEMTLKEWEQIREMIDAASKSEKDQAFIDTWFRIFEMMGAKRVDFRIPASRLLEKIFEFGQDEKPSKDYLRVYEHGGYSYTAYGEGQEFFVDSFVMDAVERIAKRDGHVTFPQMVAACFLRDDLTQSEHYEGAHIKHKAKAFEGMSAEDARPFLAAFSVELAEIMKVKAKYEAAAVVE